MQISDIHSQIVHAYERYIKNTMRVENFLDQTTCAYDQYQDYLFTTRLGEMFYSTF